MPAAQKPNDAQCLCVVVPVFNEATTIATMLRTVLAQPFVREVVVVDDGSGDGTWDALQPLPQEDARVKIFRHEKNQGKGAALRTGFSHATAPVVIVQDADLEYDPREYPLLDRKSTRLNSSHG